MNSPLLRLALTTCLIVSSQVSAQAAQRYKERLKSLTPVPQEQVIPIVDFFRPAFFASPRMNNTGTMVAALTSDEGDSYRLITYDFASAKFYGISGGMGTDVHHFQWMDEKHLLIQVSADKLYAHGLYACEAPDLQKCIPLNDYDVVNIVGVPRKDPLHPLVWIRMAARSDGKDMGVVKLDARHPSHDVYSTNSISLPRPKAEQVTGYATNNDGDLAYCLTEQNGFGRLLSLDPKGNWTPTSLDLETHELIGPGDTNSELIVRFSQRVGDVRESSGLYRYDSSTGQVGDLLYRDENYDMNPVTLRRDPDSGKVVGLSYEKKLPVTVWFDAEYKGIQAELDATFPNLSVSILGVSNGRTKFIVGVSSDIQPVQYLLYNRTAHKIANIAGTRPWIDPKRMVPMQSITYKSRDGVQIEGYFSAPPPKEGSKWPLVVLPHGGPWVRDSWGWDPEVQFLVSRGYAVFQPNYRGSDGTQFRYPSSPDWEFVKMHEDVTDGVKALIKAGLVDPKRIAIMGASFGGYLAICGAAHEGDFYRCAISIAGVFDWEEIMKESSRRESSAVKYDFLKKGLGDPQKNKEFFDAISPLRAASNIRIPIFIAHGDEDHVADVSESERLVKAIKKQKVPLEVMFRYNEGHGFHHLENQVELYARIEAFLAKYLAPLESK